MAVEALIRSGANPRDQAIRQAKDWLLKQQNPDGGWGEDWYGAPSWSSPEHTGLALYALCLSVEPGEFPQARVTATNQATGTIVRTETTSNGYYKLPYLAAEKYNVVVEKDGFAVDRVTDVPVLVGQIATIDVTLKPGSVHEEVTIKGNAVLIEQVGDRANNAARQSPGFPIPSERAKWAPGQAECLLGFRRPGKPCCGY
jgi:Carboxypeptidase regulatory-like domain/Prenyltransferase and squalene oxidase repeat